MGTQLQAGDKVYLVTVPDITFIVKEIDLSTDSISCLDRNNVIHSFSEIMLVKITGNAINGQRNFSCN